MTDTLVSTREVPWMKLGKLASKPMIAREAAELGGLNFEVEKRQMYFDSKTAPNPTSGIAQYIHKPITEQIAVVRTDTEVRVGTMSKNYPILQFGEAFDFMDQISPTYVAAGALKGGRQGFMVVKAPHTMNILDSHDPHDLYAVMRTSHDGSRAVEVCVMPLRHRCMNQLTLQSFSAGVPHRWSIKHTATMHEKLAEAQDSLAKLGAYAKSLEATASRLVKIKITDDVAQQTLEAVLPDRPRRTEQIEKIISAWHTAETVGFDWTGWGLVNAVSEYFDWQRVGGSPESRFVGALQGQTYNAINRVAGRILSRA